MEIVFGFVVGICVFCACVASFSIGFRFGHSVKNGEQPKIELPEMPKKKAEPQINEWEEGFKNIMSFNGIDNV